MDSFKKENEQLLEKIEHYKGKIQSLQAGDELQDSVLQSKVTLLETKFSQLSEQQKEFVSLIEAQSKGFLRQFQEIRSDVKRENDTILEHLQNLENLIRPLTHEKKERKKQKMYPTFNELKNLVNLQSSQQNKTDERQRPHPFWHQPMLQTGDVRDSNITDLEKEKQTQGPPNQTLPFSMLKEAMTKSNSSIQPVNPNSTNEMPQLDPFSKSFIVTEAQIVPSQTTNSVEEEATLDTTPSSTKEHSNSIAFEKMQKPATPIMYGLDKSLSALTANLEQEQKTSQSIEDETITTAITPTESVEFNQPQVLDVSHKLEETADDSTSSVHQSEDESSMSSLVQDEQVEASQTMVQLEEENSVALPSTSSLEDTLESGEQMEKNVSLAESEILKTTDPVKDTTVTNSSDVPVSILFSEEGTQDDDALSCITTTSLKKDQCVQTTSKDHQSIEENEEQGSQRQVAQTVLSPETSVVEESNQGRQKENLGDKEEESEKEITDFKFWQFFRKKNERR